MQCLLVREIYGCLPRFLFRTEGGKRSVLHATSPSMSWHFSKRMELCERISGLLLYVPVFNHTFLCRLPIEQTKIQLKNKEKLSIISYSARIRTVWVWTRYSNFLGTWLYNYTKMWGPSGTNSGKSMEMYCVCMNMNCEMMLIVVICWIEYQLTPNYMIRHHKRNCRKCTR